MRAYHKVCPRPMLYRLRRCDVSVCCSHSVNRRRRCDDSTCCSHCLVLRTTGRKMARRRSGSDSVCLTQQCPTLYKNQTLWASRTIKKANKPHSNGLVEDEQGTSGEQGSNCRSALHLEIQPRADARVFGVTAYNRAIFRTRDDSSAEVVRSC